MLLKPLEELTDERTILPRVNAVMEKFREGNAVGDLLASSKMEASEGEFGVFCVKRRGDATNNR